MQYAKLGLFLFLVATSGWAGRLPAEEGQQDANPDARNATRWRQFYRDAASKYDIVTREKGIERPLKLRKQSVMDWVSLNTFNGSIFVWTQHGRPEVVGTIFSFYHNDPNKRRVVHEFHSLSVSPVTIRAPDRQRWECKHGVELKPIREAPQPAESTQRRRIQLRSLVRDFSAYMYRADQRWELRLLTQPLYQYQSGPNNVLGGAVFAFVGYVTDPEILLLIEARETNDGPRWHFAPARFSDKSLWLQYRNQLVWETLRQGHGTNKPDTNEPHYKTFSSQVVLLPHDTQRKTPQSAPRKK